MLAVLRYTRAQVDRYALSAPELFSRIEAELLEACGVESEDRPMSFEAFAERCGREDREAWEILQRFAAAFGKQYRREQVDECDICMAELEKRHASLAAGMSDGNRTRYTLCMTAAAIAVIMLL